MAYQGEDKAKLKREREKEAIALAMEGRWGEAVVANRAILELFPVDVEALNRLGRALMELGEYAGARDAYSRALELDPHNTIARKNLARLSFLGEKHSAPKADRYKVAPHLFVEEAGKAGVVNLVHLAPKEVLARMTAGAPVSLRVKGHNLIVENGQGEYLGRVEPRHGLRLVKLIEGGNRYAAAIAGLGENEVRVLIRETYQHPSQAGLLSFPPKSMEGFRAYTRESLLRYELEEEGEELLEEEGTIAEGTRNYDLVSAVMEEEEADLPEE